MKDLSKFSSLLLEQFKEAKSSLFAIKLRMIRWICRRSFLAFCLAVKPKYIATKFHSYLCFRLQTMYKLVKDGKDQNLIVEVQPQIGKSTTCSELFPAWVLGKSHLDTGEGWPVICASYGASLAEQKSQNCRDIVNSEIYQMIFPETRLHPETAAKDFWKTTSGGSYRAVGVGGGLAGMPGKLLIADDLFKDRADADSETIRESTWKWWQAIFMSRKQDPSGVALVNTRWHKGDVAGRLEAQLEIDQASDKKKWEYDHWETLTFPAFATEDEYLDGKLFRKVGEVLCPERFSHEAMVRRQNSTEIYEWSAMYMQRPILKENAKFKIEWFRYYENEDIKLKELNWYILVDLASSKKKGADNTVVMVIGKERNTGYWFVDDYISGHLDPGQTIDAIFLLVKNHPGAKVYIEAQGYQSTLQYHVEEKQRKDLVFFTVEPLTQKSSKSKEDRIEGLIQPYKLGMIFQRRWMKQLESELLEFPQGKHDDHPDALSMAQQVMPHTAIVETPEEKQQREREEKETFDPHRPFNRI